MKNSAKIFSIKKREENLDTVTTKICKGFENEVRENISMQYEKVELKCLGNNKGGRQ